MGFEKLIDILILAWNSIWPFEVISVYQEGVRLRFGNLNKVMTSINGVRGTGFHWVIPLVDNVISESVVPTPHNLVAQSLTTRDGKTVTMAFIVTVSIVDIAKALLEVEGVKSAVNDASYGAIGTVVHRYSFAELFGDEFLDEATAEVRKRARDMGIKVHRVQISDITESFTLRVVMGN